MRLWSLHPKYLDTKGLLAAWREALLAKKVLECNTIGYKAHPQLIRFRNHPDPLQAINYYLWKLFEESINRNYHFDQTKFTYDFNSSPNKIQVTDQQIQYELQHLLLKLKQRDSQRWALYKDLKEIEPHPLFEVVSGVIADWERRFGVKS